MAEKSIDVEEERQKERVRTFSFQRNKEYDANSENEIFKDISDEDWKKLVIEDIEKADGVEKWLIFHDKDVDENGIEKKLHCHGIIRMKEAKTIRSIVKKINTQARNTKKVRYDSMAYRYLTHISDKALQNEKYVYNIEELMCWEKGKLLDKKDTRALYTKRCKGKEKDESKETLKETKARYKNSVNKGKLTKQEVQELLEEEFGEEKGTEIYLSMVKQLDLAIEERYNTKIANKKKSSHKLDTIYISGKSGVGKTAFADEFGEYLAKMNNIKASEFYVSTPVAEENGKFYMLDNYHGEDMVIMNDIDGSIFSYEEFKTRFEVTAKNAANVGNRYKNKSLIADVIVMTYSHSVYDWAREIINDGLRKENTDVGNIRKQVYRRIPIWVELETDNVVIKKYNEDTEKYEQIKKFEITQEERRKNQDEISDYLGSLTRLYRNK